MAVTQAIRTSELNQAQELDGTELINVSQRDTNGVLKSVKASAQAIANLSGTPATDYSLLAITTPTGATHTHTKISLDVGKWIDGKTIKQEIFMLDAMNDTVGRTFDDFLTDVDTVMSAKWFAKIDNVGFNNDSYRLAGNGVYESRNPDETGVANPMSGALNFQAGQNLKEVVIIIECTKTT